MSQTQTQTQTFDRHLIHYRHHRHHREAHSTETALVKVFDDILSNIETKQLTVLVALDISAAFDTICHSKLLKRLPDEFGVGGLALAWIDSYLSNRFQFVKLGRHSSVTTQCDSGVPQGSVLGPLLFVIYVSSVGDVIDGFGMSSIC